MFRSPLSALLLLPTAGALAAPPPPESEEARRFGALGKWFEAQESEMGACCSLGDGRMVEARIREGRYEVRFLHPETVSTTLKPQQGVFYPVAEEALLRGPNPTGTPIAWWSPTLNYLNGKAIGHIRCFIGAELY